MEHTYVATEQCCYTQFLVTGDVYKLHSTIKFKNLIELTLFIRNSYTTYDLLTPSTGSKYPAASDNTGAAYPICNLHFHWIAATD
jgi:hypothetical protein